MITDYQQVTSIHSLARGLPLQISRSKSPEREEENSTLRREALGICYGECGVSGMARIALFLGFPLIGAPILIFLIAGVRVQDPFATNNNAPSKVTELFQSVLFENRPGETRDLERGLNIPIPIHVPRSSANQPADSRQDPKFTRLQEGRIAGSKESGISIGSMDGRKEKGQERSMIGTFPVRNSSE